jgi:EAL domain-containing protein (putative c-di-GMP-specific phosphodiesterase class I)/GGDEF domain-containing protein
MMRSHVRDSTAAGLARRKQALLASAVFAGGGDPRACAVEQSGRAAYSGIFMTGSSRRCDDRSVDLPFAGWRLLALAEITNFAALRRLLGAARADRLVADIGERVAACAPTARTVAVGRAMVEVTVDLRGFAEAEALLADLAAAFEQPLTIDGEQHRVDILWGAAAGQVRQLEETRLIEEAEEAMALARSEQRTVLRDLSRGTPAFDRLTLTRDLRHALAKGEMFLQYQPKLHLRSQQVAGAEALVRWQHPTRGLILPGDFIPVAEESREIGPLTLWTLRRVIADQRRLAAHGHDIVLSINISGQLLADTGFVKEACRLVSGSAARIGFEITETSVIRDPETAIGHLRTFADIGIPIAIDDYGAGLSSLAYLKQLPACELKIDKMFVLQLTSSNRDPLIVRSTIDLAHALEMEVTAEGVESQAALALLSVMGCDIAQGFLISRPISFDALQRFLDGGNDPERLADPKDAFVRPASFWKSA